MEKGELHNHIIIWTKVRNLPVVATTAAECEGTHCSMVFLERRSCTGDAPHHDCLAQVNRAFSCGDPPSRGTRAVASRAAIPLVSVPDVHLFRPRHVSWERTRTCQPSAKSKPPCALTEDAQALGAISLLSPEGHRQLFTCCMKLLQ